MRIVDWNTEQEDVTPLVAREWLVTNGLGGYASGTVAGVATRRYHGMLIAALPSPLGRHVMLSHLDETLYLHDGSCVRLSGEHRRREEPVVYGARRLVQFRLEMGLPIWRYRAGDCLIEKQVLMLHEQNTVYVRYQLLEGDTVRLHLRPSAAFRPHDAAVDSPLPHPFRLTACDDCIDLTSAAELPALRMHMYGPNRAFTIQGAILPEALYAIEERRGYESVGAMWSPGAFHVDLTSERAATLVASTEEWDDILALSPERALEAELERRQHLLLTAPEPLRTGLGGELVLAADQFVVSSPRTSDVARARAAGSDAKTVIAGYHWFTDWGRDTMISLEGLTLCTHRHEEARDILRTFASAVRDGLIPNLYPEGGRDGLYHTADATMWFFHALDRYVHYTGDRATLRSILPKLREIYVRHRDGTRFNIGMDPADGLLRQGAEGLQLTWMDAKVGDWVVTPRRGKAVEINALWYNALELLSQWLREEQPDDEAAAQAQEVADLAARVRASFNRRFWYEEGGYLYDVLDGPEGDDPACRPNQLLAISLPRPILDRRRWEAVLKVAEKQLLTPLGLRSLAPGHPDYKEKYYGDLRARDAAYHQGTVWGWLIGPYLDARWKLAPDDREGARRLLAGFDSELSDAGMGSISEVFDAEPPFTPRGCIAQAWSVAEVLRCLYRIAEADVSEEADVREGASAESGASEKAGAARS